MKKTKLVTAILTVVLSSSLFAAKSVPHEVEPTYLQEKEIPNNAVIFDKAPALEGNIFENDKVQYENGKKIRETARGKQASIDAGWGGDAAAQMFSEAFGYKINKQTTPAIYSILEHVMYDAGGVATKDIKKKYHKIRPYSYFKEHTCNTQGESELSANGSYPSGHTSYGWAAALVLAEINPDRQTEILKRGYDIGQSRVICGYHWQSDIATGRLIGSAAVARLHTKDNFNKDLALAKLELLKLKNK